MKASAGAAVVEAYGRGDFELEEVAYGGRGGPTFPTGKPGRDYSLLTVARFLGWTMVKGSQATNACRHPLGAGFPRGGGWSRLGTRSFRAAR